MLSVEEALREVLLRATARPAAVCLLDESLVRVLAEDISSDIDSPPHDKSLVDGYAVVAADFKEGPAELDILEEVTAGALPTRIVTRGNATRIMTGAPIPGGADAVVMVEQTQPVTGPGLGSVRVSSPKVTRGQNIMRRATSMTSGQLVLRSGSEIRPIEIGVMAEVGRTQVRVVRQPTVGVLATGNELVPVSQTPAPGQIRNSNGPMLVAAVRTCGAAPLDLGFARDDRQELLRLIAAGLECDALVISGGVSAGVLDLVPGVLDQLGVSQVFHKVNLKPGKPLWFGVLASAAGDKLVFGLPGNPVSSLVCFELFVRPAIGRLTGLVDVSHRETKAKLSTPFSQRADRPTYFPARLSNLDNDPTIEPLAWQGSGDLRTLAEANALAYFPAGQHEFKAGEIIRVLPLGR
jgi:molybdopterin molybdotransferase